MILTPETMDVWKINWTKIPEAFSTTAQNHLTADERLQAERFKIPDDKKRRVIARALLRYLSGRYLAVDPMTLRFETGIHGKPYLLNNEKLSFNVSHSGDWVFIAFASGHEIGVDVQLIDTRSRFNGEKVANYAFHPLEKKAVETCFEKEQLALFFSIWACKEAVIKAAGLGLHGVLETFSVFPLPEKDKWASLSYKNEENPETYVYRKLEADSRHKAAIAVKGEAGRVLNIREFSFSDINFTY